MSPSTSRPARPIFDHRNHTALFLWGFMTLWMGGLSAGFHIWFRDGAVSGWEALILPAMALGGAGASVWAFCQPLVRVTVFSDGTIAVSQRRAFWRTRVTLAPADILSVDLDEVKDSDGDPYFEGMLRWRGGQAKFAEGHTRQAVEEVRGRLAAALRPSY